LISVRNIGASGAFRPPKSGFRGFFCGQISGFLDRA
jgi:hypothetical protein